MSKNIELSEEHGVNPSVTVCAYCGGTTGIALMGKLKGDKEAPKEIVSSPLPCEECIKDLIKDNKTMILIVKDGEEEYPADNLTGEYLTILASNLNRNYSPVVYMNESTLSELRQEEELLKKEEEAKE